jgi:hypothetical protein
MQMHGNGVLARFGQTDARHVVAAFCFAIATGAALTSKPNFIR